MVRSIRVIGLSLIMLHTEFGNSHTMAQGPIPLATLDLHLNLPKRSIPQWIEFVPSGNHLAIRYAEPYPADSAVLAVFDITTGKGVVSAKILGGYGFLEGSAPRCIVSSSGEWILYYSGGSPCFLPIPPASSPVKNAKHVKPDANLSSVESRDQIWLSSDGRTLWCIEHRPEKLQYSARKWDLHNSPSGVPLINRTVNRSTEEMSSFTLSTAGGLLAASIRVVEKPDKSVIEIWTLEDKPKKTTLKQHRGATSLTFSKEGRHLAATYDDGTVAWWD